MPSTAAGRAGRLRAGSSSSGRCVRGLLSQLGAWGLGAAAPHEAAHLEVELGGDLGVVMASFVERVARLMRAAHSAGRPVMWIRTAFLPDGVDALAPTAVVRGEVGSGE